MYETLVCESPLTNLGLDSTFFYEGSLKGSPDGHSILMLRYKQTGLLAWVKMPKPSDGGSMPLAEEAKILSSIHCPGVMQLQEDCSLDPNPYLAFKWSNERALSEVDLEQIPLTDKIRIALELTSTVNYLETLKRPVSLGKVDLNQVMLSLHGQARLLGVPNASFTAVAESHKASREFAWTLSQTVLADGGSLPDSLSDMDRAARQWINKGTGEFPQLEKSIAVAIVNEATRDL